MSTLTAANVISSGTISAANLNISGSYSSVNVQVSFKTADYTLTTADSGTVVFVTNTTTSNVTVPNNLPAGFRCYVTRLGTGNTKFVNATGLTMLNKNSSNTINTQYGSGSVMVINTTACVIDGQI